VRLAIRQARFKLASRISYLYRIYIQLGAFRLHPFIQTSTTQMRRPKFFFGRLHLAGYRGSKYEFLLGGLRTKKLFKHRRYLWGFFDVNEVHFGDLRFVEGYLVKLSPLLDEEVADLSTHQLAQAAIENRTIAKSRFFVQPESALIAFTRSGGHISIDQFRRYFADVFKEEYEGIFVDADIQLIEERFRFLDQIERLQAISVIEFSLHPTNPNYDEFYEKTDKRLRELEAESYQERYELKPDADAEKVREDAEIKGKILMAEDGYGVARVTGTVDGRVQTISTSQNPIVSEAPGAEIDAEEILTFIISTFRRIIGRIQ
jgi:hypothetical protein